jgi:hypothetical protein
MTTSTVSVKMWLIRKYFHDLSEYFAGDENRFGRMVGREGKNFETASPSGWAKHIVNCVTDEVRTHHSAEVDGIYAQLRTWGLLASEVIT